MVLLETIARALRNSPRVFAYTALGLWIVVIFYFSSQPPPEPHAVSGPFIGWLMNLRHAPAFGILAVFALWSTSRAGQRLVASRKRVWIAVLLAGLYGVTDEIHQSFVPGRDASVCDILTDLAGAWLAARLLWAVEEHVAVPAYGRILAAGVPACAIAAWMATYAGRLWPHVGWL